MTPYLSWGHIMTTTELERKRIGDYEVIRPLGHGGMGEVYLVRNVISDRVEAMKVLLPDLAQQQELANRFLREIKVLASLEHPNIAQLRTAFTAENQLIMIMEYVEGDTLAHRLERGAFPPSEALDYTEQVLAALRYAHAKGIIHRDIKPANMMLTPQGVVKLMDFGIARASSDAGMTATGTTLGSLDYMSPEQVKAEPVDARSDLYSVGVSLYEMVTGQRMFRATSDYSVMEAHVKEIPRAPIELQPALPKMLSDIIMMAVAKDPAQRFQTADAFRNALSQCGIPIATAGSTQAPVAAAPPTRPPTPTPAPVAATPPPLPQEGCAVLQPRATPPRRHLGWWVVAAIVILVALFGGTQVYRSHKPNALPVSSPPVVLTPAQPAAQEPSATPAQPAAEPPSSDNLAPVPAQPSATPRAPKAAAPPPGPSPEELAAQKRLMEEMEVEADQLDSRAAAVESSLDTLEQQMHQSGVGLRGDMVVARTNMRTDLAKAKQALETMDTDRARKYLDMTHRELEKLEAFLGRR